MTLIRGGKAALVVLSGVALLALPGCTPGADPKGPTASPEAGRFRGEPWEPQEQAQQRLARALEDLLGKALPGARFSPYTPGPGESAAPRSVPLIVGGDRLGYSAIVGITDRAGLATLLARIGPKANERECVVPAGENVPATDPPAVPATERRPDGTILFGSEFLSKDDKTPSVIQAGAYQPDRTCVQFDLQNYNMAGDPSKSGPTRKGLPLERAALADLAADPSLTVFPPGFAEPR